MKWMLVLLFAPILVQAQNVAINSDGSKPDKNAMLDIKSSNKGLLIPRITTEARMKISNTQGLLVYDVNTNSFWFNTGRKWLNMAEPQITNGPSGYWDLTGNAGTIDATNFIGTTDNVPFNVRVNNERAGRIDHINANTTWGYRAGMSMTTGYNNSAVGSNSLALNTTGINNSAFGERALQNNTTGFENTAVGRLALYGNAKGNSNTAVGSSALFSTDGNYNVALGSQAMFTAHGDYSTAVGASALGFNENKENTAVGGFALNYNFQGIGNTAVGMNALRYNMGGNYNTAIGYEAGMFNAGGTGAVTNSTSIGNGAMVDASNKIRIGNAAVTVIEGQVPFTTPSDGRFKFNIAEDVKGLEFILKLRPVIYQFDVARFDNKPASAEYAAATNMRRSGFIAQEVEDAANKSGYDFSGLIKPSDPQQHYSLSYDAFVVPLVKAVQQQQLMINAQQSVNEALLKKMESMQQELDALKKTLHLKH